MATFASATRAPALSGRSSIETGWRQTRRSRRRHRARLKSRSSRWQHRSAAGSGLRRSIPDCADCILLSLRRRRRCRQASWQDWNVANPLVGARIRQSPSATGRPSSGLSLRQCNCSVYLQRAEVFIYARAASGCIHLRRNACVGGTASCPNDSTRCPPARQARMRRVTWRIMRGIGTLTGALSANAVIVKRGPPCLSPLLR